MLLPVAQATKVAVLAGDNPDLEPLLIAQLGEKKELEILSRADLPALAAEAGNFSRTGTLHLAGADRLVVLQKTGEAVTVQVVDCPTGAVIYQGTLPAQLDPAAQADLLALRLPRYLQGPLKPDARRIALQGFRFVTNSEENRSLEARLNLACALALQKTGEAVVLERWRMKDLVFENSLGKAGREPFWQAASLVEGSITQTDDTLAVRLAVKNPSATESRLETVEGKITDLPELANRLAAAILKIPATPADSTQAEAQDYLREARWLMAHSLVVEAAQAAEAAVALDPGNQQAEILRLRAYARGAYPDDLTIKLYLGSPGYGGDIHAENVAQSVTMATEMSRLIEDYLAKYPPPKNRQLEDEPVTLGLRAMHTSLCVLQAAHDYDYFLRDPAAVEQLRLSTQRNAATLHARAIAMYRSNLDIYLICYAAYRAATPQEAIAIYREALRRDAPLGFPGSKSWPVGLRYTFFNTIGREPPLLDVDPANRNAARPARVLNRVVSWKPDGQKEALQVWEAYLKELTASADPLEKADGLRFRWGSQALDADREKALSEILDFLEAQPDLLRGPDGRAIAQTLTAPMKSLSYVHHAQLYHRFVDVMVRLFAQDTPLPYELVGSLREDFAYREGDPALADDMTRLEEAMQTQLSRMQGPVDHYYLGVLQSSLGGLMSKFPPPAQEPPETPKTTSAPTLTATRLWLWKDHALISGHGGLDASSGVWHDGNIWFTESGRVGFWKIDPADFQSEFLQGEKSPTQLRGLNGDCRPLFHDGKIYVSSGYQVWSFDPDVCWWHHLQMPSANYLLYEANGAIWAFFGNGPWARNASALDQGTGLFRIDTKADTAELIFSTRRHPSEHPLEREEVALPFALFSGTDGQPVLGLSGLTKRFVQLKDGAKWNGAVADRVWERSSLPEGTLLSQRLNFGSGPRKPPLLEAVVGVDPKGLRELLLLDPRVEKEAKPPLEGKPVWEIPESLNAYPAASNRSYVPAMTGDRLFVLIYDAARTGDQSSLIELYVFQRGQAAAARLPLRFAMNEEDKGKVIAQQGDPEKDMHPNPHLLAGEKGLVVTCADGFWFIPMDDVNRALAQAPAAAN